MKMFGSDAVQLAAPPYILLGLTAAIMGTLLGFLVAAQRLARLAHPSITRGVIEYLVLAYATFLWIVARVLFVGFSGGYETAANDTFLKGWDASIVALVALVLSSYVAVAVLIYLEGKESGTIPDG